MKVRELYQYLIDKVDKHQLSLDDEVIITDYHNYGVPMADMYKDNLTNINQHIKQENQDVLCLKIEHDIFEPDDIGKCNMWVDDVTLDYFKSYIEEHGED